jgi:hypothetical protein
LEGVGAESVKFLFQFLKCPNEFASPNHADDRNGGFMVYVHADLTIRFSSLVRSRIFKLRLTAEMAIRFAMALEVTTDELLRPNGSKPLRRKPSRRVLRRMERIQDLPPRRQYFVLKALDALLSSSAK